MQIKAINMVWITVNDLDVSIAFYKDVVGMKLFQHTPKFGWAEMQGEGGARLGLAQASFLRGEEANLFSPGDNAVPCLGVDNIDEAITHFKGKGVELLGEMIEIPGHVKMQNCSDKDGNKFQLVCEL